MRIEYIRISNFKSIDNLEIKDIENALILVGQNNTGKSTVIDAIRAVCGDYKIQFADFDDSGANIEISIRLRIFDSDLANLQKMGLVSRCRRYEHGSGNLENGFRPMFRMEKNLTNLMAACYRLPFMPIGQEK